jgi:hypothetical protein
MRMLVTLEFADAGAKSGQHRVLIIGRNGSAVVQVRCALLNDELLEAFRRWFPEAGGRRLMLPYRWLPHGS